MSKIFGCFSFSNGGCPSYYAVGGLSYWSTAEIDVWTDSNGVVNRKIDYEFKIIDRYNWDAGKGVPLPAPVGNDEFWQDFHRQGFAREYDIHGSDNGTIILK